MADKPLWSAEDQSARLAELTASTADASKELPLRRDVRSLGMLLGRVLVEQAGEQLFEVVEQLRRLLIRQRKQHTASPSTIADKRMARAQEIIAGLGVEDAHRVTKAFASYFELTNLAETNHRKRRRRAATLHPEQPPLAGSFRGTLLRMRAAGLSAEDALAALRKVKVIPGIYGASYRGRSADGPAEAPPHRQTTAAPGSPSALGVGCGAIRNCNPCRNYRSLADR